MTSKRLSVFAPASALLLLLGCSSPTTVPEGDPLAADPPVSSRTSLSAEASANPNGPLLASENGWGSFFPLEDGKTWNYEGRFDAWLTPTGGTREHLITVDYQEVWEIDGTAELQGEEYAVVHVSRTESTGGVYESCVYLRQTQDGLFERFDPCPGASSAQEPLVASARDLARGRQALRTAPGVSPARIWLTVDELRSRIAGIRQGVARSLRQSSVSPQADEYPTLTRLAYPLHPGASWLVVRYDDGAEFSSLVVDRERVAVPGGQATGWRFQMLSNLFDGDTEAYLTYGKYGFLGYEIRASGLATDETGQEIGIVDSYDEMRPAGASGGSLQ